MNNTPVERRRLRDASRTPAAARKAAAEREQSAQWAAAIYLADQDKIRALTRRVHHLERTVRTFLGARLLTTRQRAELVGVLAGLRAPVARPRHGGLTATEKRGLFAGALKERSPR